MKEETRKIATMQDWKLWFGKHWTELELDYVHSSPEKVTRLFNCSAHIMYFKEVIVLRSYSTNVAVYDLQSGDLFINGYYSATTCQHVSKFKTWLNRHGYTLNHWFNSSANSRGVLGESLEYAFGYYKLYKKTGLNFIKYRTNEYCDLNRMVIDN